MRDIKRDFPALEQIKETDFFSSEYSGHRIEPN